MQEKQGKNRKSSAFLVVCVFRFFSFVGFSFCLICCVFCCLLWIAFLSFRPRGRTKWGIASIFPSFCPRLSVARRSQFLSASFPPPSVVFSVSPNTPFYNKTIIKNQKRHPPPLPIPYKGGARSGRWRRKTRMPDVKGKKSAPRHAPLSHPPPNAPRHPPLSHDAHV